MGAGFRGGDNSALRGVCTSGSCAVDTDFCVVATDLHTGEVDADSFGDTAVRATDFTVMGLRAITLGDVAGSNACNTATVPFRLLPLLLVNSATSCVLNRVSSRVLARSLPSCASRYSKAHLAVPNESDATTGFRRSFVLGLVIPTPFRWLR